jgi:exodeoxyribonuclease V beta subunit
VARHRREDAGESLRLLYVALTRAQSQVVVWYAAADLNTPASPLHRMLFGRRPGTAAVPDEQVLVSEDRLPQILGAWQDAGGPTYELAALVPPDPAPLQRSSDILAARTFSRTVDTTWRRTSYSSLSAAATAGSHAEGGFEEVLSEPEELPEEDDAVVLLGPSEIADASAELAVASVPSPLADLPVGATFGSLVHAVLEHADPAADDFRAELLAHVREQLVWWPVDLDPGALADALVTVCSSPLGPLAGERTLLDLGLPDRLRELDFELPLAGGDDVTYHASAVTLGDLAPLLRRHLRDGDPVLSYASTLEHDPELGNQPLLGYLTGSIDVVLRVDVEGSQRFLTVDYKTNWLGDLDAPLTAYDYRPAMLDEAMAHSDYPLQALLYTVVLHRFLRWRLPGYDPATHLGGVLYLYLRGMCGPHTPRIDGAPCGIFAWRPPVPLVEALSALLDGARDEARRG